MHKLCRCTCKLVLLSYLQTGAAELLETQSLGLKKTQSNHCQKSVNSSRVNDHSI